MIASAPSSSAARIQASFDFLKVSSAGVSSGSARWRPFTFTARWSSSSRSALKCWRAQWARSAAVRVSWSAWFAATPDGEEGRLLRALR